MELKNQTFKTLRLENGQLVFYEETVRQSSEPQLIVRPRLVGICRSDIKEFLGTRTVRHDFGHEILGEVIATNDERLQKIGSTVVLDPHVKIQRTSGFGELVVASGSIESLTKAFVTVPSSVADNKLIFVEPLACAHHCVANLLRFEQRDTLKGMSVSVVGAGMTGVLIGLLSQHYGADVTLINRSRERLNFIEQTMVFPKENLQTIDDVNEEFDVVIPTTTFLSDSILTFCESIVKTNGTILLYGGTKEGDSFPGFPDIDVDSIRRKEDVAVLHSEKTPKVCGTHGATTKDFTTVAALLDTSGKTLPLEKLISQRISLEELAAMIMKMTKEDVFGKTVVVIDQSSQHQEENA